MPNGTNVTELVPVITHTGESISPASGVAQDFTGSVTYTVTAADGSSQDYTVTVGQLAAVITVYIYTITENTIYMESIAGTSATGGGNVTDEGASAVTERGLCWNTSGSPTTSESHISDPNYYNPEEGFFPIISMTGLTVNTTYHVRAYAINSQGTAYGNEITFNSGYTFGTEHAGGYVFYNDGNGGGLVSAKSDQGSSQWADSYIAVSPNTSIGSGLVNTCTIADRTTGSAAKVCLDYDDGIYSDWYLPSLDELTKMCVNLKDRGVGAFSNEIYWSSSWCSYYSNTAYYINFGDSSLNYTDQKSVHSVRAIRAF